VKEFLGWTAVSTEQAGHTVEDEQETSALKYDDLVDLVLQGHVRLILARSVQQAYLRGT
jgi:hypothetical protein